MILTFYKTFETIYENTFLEKTNCSLEKDLRSKLVENNKIIDSTMLLAYNFFYLPFYLSFSLSLSLCPYLSVSLSLYIYVHNLLLSVQTENKNILK